MARPFINDRRPGPMGDWGNRVGEAFAVLCADGVIRTATVTAQDADTYFSIPARVQVRGKSVSGFVMGRDISDEADPIYRFHAYQNRKNAGVISGN